MGIIPDQPVYGNDCLYCWEPGKTPLYLKAFFSGIKRGELWLDVLPPPPNGYWDLVQSPGSPCIWEEDGIPPPWIDYRVGLPTNQLVFTFQVGVVAFRHRTGVQCNKTFTNEFTEWNNSIFYGGYGYVATSFEVGLLVEKVTPMIDPDPRMECFPQPDREIVIRYAGKRDGTNLYIKFDPDA